MPPINGISTKKIKVFGLLFCFVFDLNKNLTLKKDNLFSFSSLNRFFALSLQRNQILNKDYYGNGN